MRGGRHQRVEPGVRADVEHRLRPLSQHRDDDVREWRLERPPAAVSHDPHQLVPAVEGTHSYPTSANRVEPGRDGDGLEIRSELARVAVRQGGRTDRIESSNHQVGGSIAAESSSGGMLCPWGVDHLPR